MSKNTMIIYADDLDNYADLSDGEYGKLIRSALLYESEGIEPVFSDRALSVAFRQIKLRNNLNRQKYEAVSKARSEAGKKGGAPKGNQNARKWERQRTPEEFEALEEKLINK